MKYADKTFWKMFSGFVTIIIISLIFITLFKIEEMNNISKDIIQAQVNK